MSEGQQVNFFAHYGWIVPFSTLLIIAASCTTPKRYQKFKPFVYRTNINIDTKLPASKKAELKASLENQLDDSLKVRTVLAIGFTPPFFYNRLSKPAVFDSINVDRSKTFMSALLSANGYLNPVITDTFRVDTVRDQHRVTVDFFVSPGKVFRLDSVGYDLQTPELQRLALQNRDKTFLKKGDPYSLQNISAELDRLLGIYRDHGYYKISKEDVFAERDTVVAALIDPTIDPFEQVLLLEELRRRRENPTMTVVIKQRSGRDTTHIDKFYVGNITVYPDMLILDDTVQTKKDSAIVNGIKFFYGSRRFKLPFVARNIALKPGELYKQTNYFKTINTFTNLGAWQQVDIDLFERYDSVPLLDARLRLYPTKKLSLNVDFETSRNVSDALTTGSLFGIGFVVGVRNRNAFRESIQTTTNVRFGVELGTNIVQTAQTIVSHNIAIPRFLKPFRVKNVDDPRTLININASYTNRREFFEVRSANVSMGYSWSKKPSALATKANSWQFFPINLELTDVIKTDSFLKLEERIPALKQSFKNGLIISFILAFNRQKISETRSTFYRARLESSGALAGFIKSLERNNLRRFVKMDLELKHFIKYTKSELAFRAFGGYGYVYGKTGNEPEYNLPFFKAFFAGGPYSMRAWPVRRLGPGSSKYYDTSAVRLDRFGDMQLEGNVEYRFNLATIAGIKLKSALFIDVGNIWARTADRNNIVLEDAQFKLSRLYKDLAIGAGTSLRFDFDFFLIRLDWAYQLKNPAYTEVNGGWFYKFKLLDGQFQLGIGYPF
ncbi:MAG: BamA/TamA family outer membrane protein [Chitinophagaceae bacterium]|nr:BamA/TamA family outer membrane protein [Chitinophagaceae bacterium]